jgi:single-stranded DNA-binding protein
MSATSTTTIPAVNVAVLCGACSAPAEVRVLESGTRLATLAVRCPAGSGADERATSVPVTVWDPPAWIESLEAGDAVVVVGRVRRRFYQRPGGVGSRVDLEADVIGRARDRRRIEAVLRRTYEALEALG